jgi:hypothetical protein
MAMGVVHLLEPVEIEEQERKRPAAAGRALRFPAQRGVQVP